MGVSQNKRDPAELHDRVVEFEQWATEQGCTLQPAFQWRPAGFEDDDDDPRKYRTILTPLITLAIYDTSEQELAAVYPHVDGEEVQTIHDGIKAVESIESEQSTNDEKDESRVAPLL